VEAAVCWGAGVTVARASNFVVLAFGVLLAEGCQYVGPISIDQGRDRYNGVIQATSKEQTFSNIIRVHNNEPTSFMDVSEVDATTMLSGTVAGGASNIGAIAGTKSTTAGTISGAVGTVSGGATYTEQPLIRYVPLLGQALVAQLVTPVSADALADLYDSSWRICPVLDLAASNLTSNGLSEFFPVLNILCELSRDEAISVAATKSDLTKEQSENKFVQAGTIELSTKPASSGNNDSLTIYLNPFTRLHRAQNRVVGWRELQLWIRLLWLYSGTQPKFSPKNAAACADSRHEFRTEGQLRTWDLSLRQYYAHNTLPKDDPNAILACLPTLIELRTKPVPFAKVRSENLATGAPLLKTYSAIGILKNATELPGPRVAFVSPVQYQEIISLPWNQKEDNLTSLVSYTLTPSIEASLNYPTVESARHSKFDDQITKYLSTETNIFVYDPRHTRTALSVDDYLIFNRRLASLRRFILIIMDDHLPSEQPYVSHFDHGIWYYIDARDQVSQRNFDLISLFLTMMAVPSALPPIAPTIAVGGSG
jgi:hypothetical protein